MTRQWSNFKKSMILVVCALYSFLGNSALLGPSVYISIFAEEFGISQNAASGLISYANLAFGFGRFSTRAVARNASLKRTCQDHSYWCPCTTSLADGRSCSVPCSAIVQA